LAEAVVGARFDVVNAHPLKAEMSVAAPKSQVKEPIQLDVVLVCRKREADRRPKSDSGAAVEQAVERASAKARRLASCGLTLSVNDRRVIVISQFLVAACAGRSAHELGDVLSIKLTDLDLAAMRLLAEGPQGMGTQAAPEATQLAFFERAEPLNRGRPRGTLSPAQAKTARARREPGP